MAVTTVCYMSLLLPTKNVLTIYRLSFFFLVIICQVIFIKICSLCSSATPNRLATVHCYILFSQKALQDLYPFGMFALNYYDGRQTLWCIIRIKCCMINCGGCRRPPLWTVLVPEQFRCASFWMDGWRKQTAATAFMIFLGGREHPQPFFSLAVHSSERQFRWRKFLHQTKHYCCGWAWLLHDNNVLVLLKLQTFETGQSFKTTTFFPAV